MLSQTSLHRLVFGLAGGTGLGVCGYIRWEASGFKAEASGIKADVQELKESMATLTGQQNAILVLLGEEFGNLE